MQHEVLYPDLKSKDSLNILVVDGGMRGEALRWKLGQSDRAGTITVTPFNISGNKEIKRINALSLATDTDLAVVSQDNALASGVVDSLQSIGIPAFGPSKDNARIESSKVFMKEVASQESIPTSAYKAFINRDDAHRFVDVMGDLMVIKDDFLAEGKASVVCTSNREGHRAVEKMFNRNYSNLGELIIIEAFSDGRERSGHAVVSNQEYLLFPTAEDHKQLLSDDQGPMTGGMGVITPAPWLDAHDGEVKDEDTIKKLLHALPNYKGVLYPGYKGSDLLEVNARFGSPEIEAYVRNMRSDLLEHMVATVNQKLGNETIVWDSRFAISVVGAAVGYPDAQRITRGQVIGGLEAARAVEGIQIFLGSVAIQDGTIYSNGGRLFAVTATGDTPDKALATALEAMDKISVGNQAPIFREDIGKRNSK